mgnify:FL=1
MRYVFPLALIFCLSFWWFIYVKFFHLFIAVGIVGVVASLLIRLRDELGCKVVVS